jgi:uncharacterized OB-fold protein
MEPDPPYTRIAGGIGADDAYWDYLDQGEFRLQQCATCGRWIWPANYRCAGCGGWDLAWIRLEPEGRVYSWTRTWYPFDRTKERAEDVPYAVGLAEIRGAGGSRVIGVLKGDEAGLKIGARVRGEIQPRSPKSKGYPSICWMLA